MRRYVLLALAAALLVPAPAASGYWEVNTTSQWENGGDATFGDIRLQKGEVSLEASGVDKEWYRFTPRIVWDVVRDENLNAYMAGAEGGDAIVRKVSPDNTTLWTASYSLPRFGSIDLEGDYIYAGSRTGEVVKLTKGGSKETTYTQPDDQAFDVEAMGDDIYVSDVDDPWGSPYSEIRKIDQSAGTDTVLHSESSRLDYVEPNTTGYFYTGGIQLRDPSGGLVDSEPYGTGDLDYARDGKLYAQDGESIVKLFRNLTLIWRHDSFDEAGSVDGVSALDSADSGGVVFATGGDDDFSYRLDSEGNKLWEIGNFESAFGAASLPRGGYKAGKRDPSGGYLTKLGELYETDGEYGSGGFDAGSMKYWHEVQVDSDLNGGDATLEVWLSDTPGFPAVASGNTEKKTFPLTGGEESFYLDDAYRQHAKFNLSVTRGPSDQTPRFNYVNFTYGTFPVGPGVGRRVETRFDHGYPAIITSDRFQRSVQLRVRNPTANSKDLITSVSGSNAELASGGTQESYSLPAGGSRSFTVQFRPDSDGWLNASTVDQDFGIGSSESIRVESRDVSTSFEREVPGISSLGFLLVGMAATVYYLLP